MHIAFVIPNLGPGGAERVASLLSNDWVARGHTVDLITFEEDETEPFHALDQGIGVHRLQAKRESSGTLARATANLRRISLLRSLLRGLRPDIVVAFMTEANVVALAACRALPFPVVVSERNQPNRPGLGRLRRLARRASYNWAAAIVMQTEELAAWARARFRIPVHVIPNPVAPNQVASSQTKNRSDRGTFRVVSIGRLTEQKGFDILIESFGQLAEKYADWSLVIYGEGAQRPALTRMIEARNLERKAALPGLTRDVASALSEATIFVLPSRFEGFPNVLLEALSRGLPVIATDCPGGNAKVLANGAYGTLVPPDDIPALTAALETMMTNPQLRGSYAMKAPEAARNFELAKISVQWLELLEPIATGWDRRRGASAELAASRSVESDT